MSGVDEELFLSTFLIVTLPYKRTTCKTTRIPRIESSALTLKLQP
jgi:hypothetical protein